VYFKSRELAEDATHNLNLQRIILSCTKDLSQILNEKIRKNKRSYQNVNEYVQENLRDIASKTLGVSPDIVSKAE
jgi:chorismate mutase